MCIPVYAASLIYIHEGKVYMYILWGIHSPFNAMMRVTIIVLHVYIMASSWCIHAMCTLVLWVYVYYVILHQVLLLCVSSIHEPRGEGDRVGTNTCPPHVYSKRGGGGQICFLTWSGQGQVDEGFPTKPNKVKEKISCINLQPHVAAYQRWLLLCCDAWMYSPWQGFNCLCNSYVNCTHFQIH